jgi:NADPH2:quinone reductase
LPAPWNTELDYSPLKDSQILIVGGGSNCGRFATQLASLAGFGTIIVVGGQEEELKTFGATHIIDRHGGQYVIVQQIRDVAGDELMYAFDAINGPPNHHLAINALSSSKRGKLARIVHSRGVLDESSIHPKKAGYELKNISGISSLKPGVAIPFWKNVERYLVQGDIRPSKYAIHRGLDAQAVNEVLDRYRDGKVVAQTHFHISE